VFIVLAFPDNDDGIVVVRHRVMAQIAMHSNWSVCRFCHSHADCSGRRRGTLLAPEVNRRFR